MGCFSTLRINHTWGTLLVLMSCLVQTRITPAGPCGWPAPDAFRVAVRSWSPVRSPDGAGGLLAGGARRGASGGRGPLLAPARVSSLELVP